MKNFWTKYDGTSATLEIAIMLLGAFLLGALLMWAYDKFLFECIEVDEDDELKEDLKDDTIENRRRDEDIQRQIEKYKRDIVNTEKESEIKTYEINHEVKKKIDNNQELVKRKKEYYPTVYEEFQMRQGEKIEKREIEAEKVENNFQKNSLKEKENVLKEENEFSTNKKQKEGNFKNNQFLNKNEDNLKIIEGIGPKIEKILKSNGILNLKQLSQKTPQELKDILLKVGGDRYAFHDPTTWPDQAKLAAENKYIELKEYQEFLKGGKKY